MKLMLGDCLERMQEIPDESIDLVVTSPPYDNMRLYHGYSFDYEATIKELYRIVKRGGCVVWIVADQTKNGSETGTSFKQALCFRDTGFNIHDTMIWCKDGGGGFSSIYCYMQNTEYMFVFSKGKPKAVNLIRDHKNKHAGEKKVGHGRRFINGKVNDENGKERICPEYSKRNNWWLYPRKTGYGGHPATFPVGLVQDHIISWSNTGDVVLDPFMGSGTTGVACINTDRDFIGIEIDPEYFEIAKERIEKTMHASEV